MRTFKISFTPSIYYFYLFAYTLCLIVMVLSSDVPFKWIKCLFIFLACIAIFFILLCQNFTFKKANKFKQRRIRTQYTHCVALASCSTLLFVAGVIAFNLSSELSWPATFFLFSYIALFFSLSLFLSESEYFEKHYKEGITWLFKLAWIAVTFYCYALARHTFMTLADLTYEQTATRLTVIGYAGILTTLFISAVMMILFLGVVSFETASVSHGNKQLIMKRDVNPILIPVLITPLIAWSYFSTHTSPVLNFAFSVIVPLETRDTFTCHNQQLYIPDGVTRYYLEAGKNDYRVFEHHDKQWEVRRLACQDTKPWYRLSEIKNREDLVTEKLQALSKAAQAMQHTILRLP